MELGPLPRKIVIHNVETRGVRELGAIRKHHVSAYTEGLSRSYKGVNG